MMFWLTYTTIRKSKILVFFFFFCFENFCPPPPPPPPLRTALNGEFVSLFCWPTCPVLPSFGPASPRYAYDYVRHACIGLHTSAQLAVDTIPARALWNLCVRSVVCTVFNFFRGNQTHFRVTTATSFDVGDISYRITYYLYTRQPSLEKYQISNNMVPPPPHFQKIRTINM